MRPSQSELGRGALLKALVTEAHKVLDDLLTHDMSKLGLSLGEADVLTVIIVADHEPTPSEIADWLSLTGAGTTGRLKGLESEGLIERRPHPRDGRSVTVRLTDTGLHLARQVIEAKDSAILNHIVDSLGTSKADLLNDHLSEVIASSRAALESKEKR